MQEIKIGWAEADITPEATVGLAGQYYPRTSRGIHSRLKAVVLAMESEAGVATILVSLDVLAVPASFLQRVRELVKAAVPEIDTDKIVLNATHTHSAPALCAIRRWWVRDSPDCMDADAYGAFAGELTGAAIVAAWRRRVPGGIRGAEALASVGHCRRVVYADGHAEMYGATARPDFVGLEGTEDATIELLMTSGVDGAPTGVIVNIACPSQVMEATDVVSSDYMGRTRERLRETFGPDFGVLCQVSAAGDQSPRDLVRMQDDTFWSERGVEILASRVTEAVRAAAATRPARRDVSLAHTVRTLRLPRRLATGVERDAAVEALCALEEDCPQEAAFAAFCSEADVNARIRGRPGPYDSKQHPFALMRNAEAVSDRYNDQQQQREFEMELHTIRIGDYAFVACPFELFLAFGQCIKARSPAEQTFIVQLACDYVGYLPTQVAEAHGDYGALIINGEVGSEGGARLVEAGVDEIRSLFSNP